MIKAIGTENLIGAQGRVWKWNEQRGLWVSLHDREIKQHIHRMLDSSKATKAVIESILDIIKTEIHKPNHQFNLRTESINCVNGALFVKDGEWVLYPHEKYHYCTSQIPVIYDPQAKSPLFEHFLHSIFEGE